MAMLALVLVVVAFGSGLILAMNIHPSPPLPPYQTIYWMYSVKFMCSMNINDTHPNPNGVAPGVYETDINVHNHLSNDHVIYAGGHGIPTRAINITKYVVVALPEDMPTTPPVYLGAVSLIEQQAFRIDCVEILSALASQCPNNSLTAQPYCPLVVRINPSDPHSPTYAGPVIGFVELQVTTTGTPPPAPLPALDVVAVYTTAPLNCTEVHVSNGAVYLSCVAGNVSTLEVVNVRPEQAYPPP